MQRSIWSSAGSAALAAFIVCSSPGGARAEGPEAAAPPEKPAAAASPKKEESTPAKVGYKNGFFLQTDDGKHKLSLGGYLHLDGRFFIKDEGDKSSHQFVARRVRPTLDGTVYKYFDMRLMPDFGSGKVSVQDAYVDVHFVPWIRLRVGKMKEPVGLERLQTITNTPFVELGLPTLLVPNRDVGVQVHGEIGGGALVYQLGIFDGVADGASADGDTNDDKDLAGRVFVQPFKPTSVRALHGLGLGFAATWGKETGKPDATELPQLKTPGQATFFSYSTGATPDTTPLAAGRHSRVAPQGYFYAGPLGLLGEYVRSVQAVRLGEDTGNVTTSAWQVEASAVLTGEDMTYQGVKPRGALGEGGIGAIELDGRYGALRVGEEAFDRKLANDAKSARRVTSWAAGASWHWNARVKLQADFERSTFSGGAKDGGDRKPENAILSRLQLVL